MFLIKKKRYNKNMVKPPLEAEIDITVATLVERALPPLRIRPVTEYDYPKDTATSARPTVMLEACAERLPAVRFAMEYKRQGTPKMLAAAVAEAQQYTRSTGLLPLVVVPYLPEERLLELEAQGVSGLDLCGNGVIIFPGKYTVFRTGKPNRFTTSAPIKNVYRGATSLAARALLLQPTFATVNALVDFILARGGEVSRASVSKALAGMEEDLVVSRQSGIIQVLQPDKLLILLERNFRPVEAAREVVGRSPLPLLELRRVLAAKAKSANITLCATGVSSAQRYTTLALEEQAALYCNDIVDILEGLGFEETKRFPNLRLTQTRDPLAFFDARTDGDG